MNFYFLYKSLHLISVISWMAGLLYLPRIFVYHTQAKSEETLETFKTMEKRLFFYIMDPAMILSWIFGFLLIHSIGIENITTLWFKIKIILVSALAFYHFYLLICLQKFQSNDNKNSTKFYKIINEVPTILLIITIFVVVFKPL